MPQRGIGMPLSTFRTKNELGVRINYSSGKRIGQTYWGDGLLSFILCAGKALQVVWV